MTSHRQDEFQRLIQISNAASLINLLLLLKEKIEQETPDEYGNITITFTKREAQQIKRLYA